MQESFEEALPERGRSGDRRIDKTGARQPEKNLKAIAGIKSRKQTQEKLFYPAQDTRDREREEGGGVDRARALREIEI